MLAAFVVLPAFALAYLLGAPFGLRRRLVNGRRAELHFVLKIVCWSFARASAPAALSVLFTSSCVRASDTLAFRVDRAAAQELRVYLPLASKVSYQSLVVDRGEGACRKPSADAQPAEPRTLAH